ncbi:MAG TPA: hypothetical protein VME46_11975, partial [Acidimicrobiales bacterium]|nr:hypothetical protein [Acidimicrobiales bacterium]
SLAKQVVVSAPSQDVLRVTVRAQTVRRAEQLANAVVASYITYVSGTGDASQGLLTQLQHEASELTSQILALQQEINAARSRLAHERPTSPAGEADASLISTLSTEQQQRSLELNSLNSEILNAEDESAQSGSATRVLQRADAVPTSNYRVPVIVVLGGLAGLVAGCVLAVVRTKQDRRLRSRDAVAAAVGLSVVASMWGERCKRVSDWRRLLDRSKDPSPVEAWNARRTLQRIMAVAGDAPNVDLRLLVLAGDGSAASASVKLAGSAAALGMTVNLDVGPHPVLATLRAACVVMHGPASGTAVVALMAEQPESTELRGLAANVLLQAIDPAKPEVSSSFATTLLVVSSGFATPTDLARVALAASEARSPLMGVVLTNPDPDDSTSGLLNEPGEPPRVAPRGLRGPVRAEVAMRQSP